MSIMAKERANVPKDALDRIIEASNQDIRQCINTLQLMASGTGKTPKHFQRKDITVVSEQSNDHFNPTVNRKRKKI